MMGLVRAYIQVVLVGVLVPSHHFSKPVSNRASTRMHARMHAVPGRAGQCDTSKLD